MKFPNKSSIDDSATLRTIAPILTSYITGNHTSFQTNIAVMLHGLTKSREVVDVMNQHGLGVSYDEVLMVCDYWVVNDNKRSLYCPFEVAEGKPAIVIVDNDDFKKRHTNWSQPKQIGLISAMCSHILGMLTALKVETVQFFKALVN